MGNILLLELDGQASLAEEAAGLLLQLLQVTTHVTRASYFGEYRTFLGK